MDGVIPKPKLRGKKYHYCVLYNHYEGPASRRNDDQKLSRAFLSKLEQQLAACGFTDSYYFEKILPGSNLFEVFTAGMIEPSEKVVVVLTKGFRENCWHKYTQQNSFMKLVNNGKTANFLVIVIGEGKGDIPIDFGLDREQILYFEKKWQDDDKNWSVLKECFLENKSVSALLERVPSNIPVEETHDANNLAEDGAPATRQDVPDNNKPRVSRGIEGAARPLNLHGGASATGHGVPNTNIPGGAQCGTATSESISRPIGVARGLPRGTPTTDVISNPSGPREDPVGATTGLGFPDLERPLPDDTEEDRAPSTPRTSPNDTESTEPQTTELPGYAPSIHIHDRVHQEQEQASGSDKEIPAEEKKSSYFKDVLNFISGNW